MSRRRRRDAEEEGEVLSEDDAEDKPSGLSIGSGASIDDELDVSEYESDEEEDRDSSDYDYEENEIPAANSEEQEAPQKTPGQKIILERKVENEEESRQSTVKEAEEVKPQTDVKEELSDANPERESGDGKEESDTEHTQKESERDQDDKNAKEDDDPAFIPTKGAFFQHDVRSENEPKGRGRDKKLWDRGPAKWKHDMFIMEDQMPKSREALISNYGYDIRELPANAAPPAERRVRGRGRGRGGRRGRGRGGRPQNFERDRQRSSQDEKDDYQDEYPTLDNQQNSGKLRSRSYYNKQRYPNRKSEVESTHSENNTKGKSQPKEDLQVKESQEQSSASHQGENKNQEKFSDLLQVINSRENAPSSKDHAEQTSATSRKSDKHPRTYQNSTFSNYQEAPKPRRYSSLRQRQSDSPVDRRSSPHSARSREQKYANFSKPVQPNPSVISNFSKKSTVTGDHLKNITESVEQTTETQQEMVNQQFPYSQSQSVQQHAQPGTQTGIPQMPLNLQSMSFTDPNQPNMSTPLDPTLMPMPQMLHMYNPMLNSSYVDASNYQRMLQMMTQMNMSMDQLQQLPTPIPPPMESNGTGITPDPQALPRPADMPMNSLIPPVSQTLSPGSLGSVMRPPHPPLNPPTYFTSPMAMNMRPPQQQQPQQPQQPFGFHPNLMAQQVGGVTYFNTATQSPPVQPSPNQASPRRNAAIPIMAPAGFAGPAGIE